MNQPSDGNPCITAMNITLMSEQHMVDSRGIGR
jgi:hypothetical protein